jgi:hypothetical protein
LSARGLHVVPAARRLASDENAFVDVLPKNVCAWDAPGCPWWTIGSSLPVWLNRQLLKKLFPCSFGRPPCADAVVSAASAKAPATQAAVARCEIRRSVS